MITLEAYNREITNFMRTVVIKNHLLNELMLEHGTNSYFRSEIALEHSPYDRRLLGEYILSNESTTLANGETYLNSVLYTIFDEMMTIYSLDTKTEIQFTQLELLDHPRTKTAYTIGSDLYFSLCNKYPTQIELINNIIHPIGDYIPGVNTASNLQARKNLINTLTNAKTYSVISYDSSFLETREQNSLIECMERYLLYIRMRWGVGTYAYEPMYVLGHWAIVHFGLWLYLFVQRLHNIRTANVHSYHIWEYLASHGLEGYQNTLSDKQKMFLYQNIDFIYKNAGKQYTLKVLIDNLLSDFAIELNGKSIIQDITTLNGETLVDSTTNRTSTIYRTTPMVVKDGLNNTTDSVITRTRDATIESLATAIQRQYQAKVVVDPEATLESQYPKFSMQGSTRVPTKELEFTNVGSTDLYEQIYLGILCDSLVYRAHLNDLYFMISVLPPEESNEIVINAKEAVALAFYLAWKSVGITPKNIINHYEIRYALRKEFLSLPKHFYMFGQAYQLQAYLKPGAFNKPLPYNQGFDDAESFADAINDQAWDVIHDVINALTNNSEIYQEIYDTVYRTKLIGITIEDDLLENKYDSYEEWFADNTTIGITLDKISRSKDPEEGYNIFLSAILEAILPIKNSYAKGDFTIGSNRFNKIKDLFVNLCSHTVMFTDSMSSSNYASGIGMISADFSKKIYTAVQHTNLGTNIDAVTHSKRKSTLAINTDITAMVTAHSKHDINGFFPYHNGGPVYWHSHCDVFGFEVEGASTTTKTISEISIIPQLEGETING